MKKRVGLIGLGSQATTDYIPGLAFTTDAELVAVCDINEQQVATWSEELKVNGYSDYRKLFEDESLDFVIAVAPHDVYKGIIECASSYGVHVLKEKPFARNLSEALYFKELCDKGNIYLMTTLQRRFNPIYELFARLVMDIGDLDFVEAKYAMFLSDPLMGWRGDKCRSGGGTLIDMGYHMVDILLWYFGLPDRILADFKATTTPEITSTVLFNYEQGPQGVLILSRNYPPKTEYVKVVGSQGIVELGRNHVKRMRRSGEIIETLTRELSWSMTAAKQIDYFCQVIDGKSNNFGSPADHLQHARFIDACYLSQKSKHYVNPNQLEELCLLG